MNYSERRKTGALVREQDGKGVGRGWDGAGSESKEWSEVLPDKIFFFSLSSFFFSLSILESCCREGIYRTNCRFNIIVRSYPREYTRSHQNSAVKHEWARLVLGLVTTWESLVPYVLLLHHCPSFLLITYSFGPVEPIRIEDEHWSKGKGKPRGPEINSLI